MYVYIYIYISLFVYGCCSKLKEPCPGIRTELAPAHEPSCARRGFHSCQNNPLTNRNYHAFRLSYYIVKNPCAPKRVQNSNAGPTLPTRGGGLEWHPYSHYMYTYIYIYVPIHTQWQKVRRREEGPKVRRR